MKSYTAKYTVRAARFGIDVVYVMSPQGKQYCGLLFTMHGNSKEETIAAAQKIADALNTQEGLGVSE